MSFQKFNRTEDDHKGKKVRSNYFQTEFSISINKRKDNNSCTNNSSYNVPSEKHEENDHRMKNISVQVDRNIIGQEETPKERKKWIRPPLVGQASTSTDVVIPAHQEIQSDSEGEIVETSHPTVEPTLFTSRGDYRNRKDYISEKPPEGGTGEQDISPVSNQNEFTKAASPTSSVTSSRPLEWDSGADVGYGQYYSGQNKDAELSTIERLALERGSASLLTRSDPEGTTGITVNPNIPNNPISNNSIGRPKAESTPNNTLPKANEVVSEQKDFYPLFPEVIIEERGQVSDSDLDCNKVDDVQVKKSNSFEKMTDMKSEERPATFPRSQSQANIVFNINAHLQKILANPKSNSSSSVATVVTGKKKTSQNSPEDFDLSPGDRANSFEYLPGHIYENKTNKIEFIGESDFKKDVERGVQLMAEFVKGSNANNTLLRKKLLNRVVEGLISANYLSDNEWASDMQRCVTRRSHVKDNSEESSALENEPQPSPKITSSGSAVSSNLTTNVSSAHNSSECHHSDRLFRNLPKLPPRNSVNSSVKEVKGNGFKKSSIKSTDESRTSSDWKDPVTRSEKLLEAKKNKGDRAPLNTKLLNFLHSERENQLDWIKKEINHLSSLKQLLEKHENIRKNFATLKKTKQRALSADSAIRTARPFKRRTDVLTYARSEPVAQIRNELNNRSQNEGHCESGYNSHNYDTDRGDGILRRHVSTDTRDSKIVNGWQMSQQKKSLAYTIVFEREKEKENINNGTESRNSENRSVADRETLMKTSRLKVKEQFAKMSLKDELVSKRPDYVARAEGRRQIVAELTALRELRQQHKTNVLAAAVCDSDQPVPPPPLALKRVVSQKAMRNLTEKKYKQTYEVKKKQLEIKKQEEYRANRLMADVFKKRLQRRTLKGETDLSNSVNII